MPVHFEGFPRVVAAKALKPGRWFTASTSYGPQLCMRTAVGEDDNALVVMFGLGRTDTVDFRTMRLAAIPSPLTTVEDDVVFAPGEGAEKLRLMAAVKKPFPSGSLLRLSNGDMGIGFAEKLHGQLLIVSLTSGLECEGFDFVFDRWSLMLRRGGHSALVGHFKGGAWRE
jgi:hypothetical protein